MDINSVFYSGSSVNSMKAQEAVSNYKKYEQEKAAEESSSEKASDSYVKSEETIASDSGVYSKENIKKTIEEIEAQREQAIQDMLTEMLGKQANAAGLSFLNLTESASEITLQDINEAKESVDEGGYWSVESVAGRIMDMAKTLAGGDASKFELLKNAVIKGFGGAVSKLGFDSMDEMPEITAKTYDEVMKRFDDWSQELGISTKEAEAAE